MKKKNEENSGYIERMKKKIFKRHSVQGANLHKNPKFVLTESELYIVMTKLSVFKIHLIRKLLT